MAKPSASPVIEEPLKEYGSIGDLGRYAGHGVSLAFNFAFCLFVGYVLGQMADDTFVGRYDGPFTWLGMGLGFVWSFFGTLKRLRRFSLKQNDLFQRRARKLRSFKPLSTSRIIVGFAAVFGGVSRLCDLIYLVEFRRLGVIVKNGHRIDATTCGNNAAWICPNCDGVMLMSPFTLEWLPWVSLALVGGAMTLLGVFTLLGKDWAWRPVKIALLAPLPVGAVLAWLAFSGGALPNVLVTMILIAVTPAAAFYLLLRDKEEEEET